MTIRLADWARYQTNIDYREVFNPQNVGYLDGVVVKATEGTTVVDPMFETHWKGSYQHAPVMAYHFMRSNISGNDQANFFLETIFPLLDAQGGIAVWLDVETADGVGQTTRKKHVLDFLSVCNNVFPGKVGVYSSKYLWDSLIGKTTWISAFNFWVAHWTASSNILLPEGVTLNKTLLHQYGIWNDHSWVAPIPGMNPDSDANWGLKWITRNELRDFMGINSPPPPAPSNKVTLVGEWKVTGFDGNYTEITEQ